MSIFKVTEGRTEPIDVQLLVDGAPLSLTGKSVQLILRDSTDTEIAGSPFALTVTDAAQGKVQFSPPTSGMINDADSPISAKFRVTVTATGKVFHVPEGRADRWIISKA